MQVLLPKLVLVENMLQEQRTQLSDDASCSTTLSQVQHLEL